MSDTISIVISRQDGDVVRTASIECDRRAVVAGNVGEIMAHVRRQLRNVAADDNLKPLAEIIAAKKSQTVGLHVVRERAVIDDEVRRGCQSSICPECGVNNVYEGQKICDGCKAYREHQQ